MIMVPPLFEVIFLCVNDCDLITGFEAGCRACITQHNGLEGLKNQRVQTTVEEMQCHWGYWNYTGNQHICNMIIIT